MSAVAAALRQLWKTGRTVTPPPPNGKPTAPILTAGATTQTTAGLSWTASLESAEADPLLGYTLRIYRAGATAPVSTTAFGPTVRSATASDLTADTAYTATVVGFDAADESDPSNTVSFRTDVAAPVAGMVATRAETFCDSWGPNVHMSWSNNGVEGYKQEMADAIIRLGARRFRDRFQVGSRSYTNTAAVAYQAAEQYRRMHRAGVKAHCTVGEVLEGATATSSAEAIENLKGWFPASSASPAGDVFGSFGGFNEPNSTSATAGAATRPFDWALRTCAKLKETYDKIYGGAGDPVFGPSGSAVWLASGSNKNVEPTNEADNRLGEWMKGSASTSWKAWYLDNLNNPNPTKFTVASQAAMLGVANAKVGDVAVRTDQTLDLLGMLEARLQPRLRSAHRYVDHRMYRLDSLPASVLSNWSLLSFHPGTQRTDTSDWITHGDYHNYPGGDSVPSNALVQRQSWARAGFGNKPFLVTEAGYHTNLVTQMGGQGVSEEVQGLYLPILMAEHYKYGMDSFGVGNVQFHYELMEEPNKAERESGWGIVAVPAPAAGQTLDQAAHPSNWYDKPALIAMKNLLTILGDRDNSVTPPRQRFGFTPGRLDVSVTGGNSATVGDNGRAEVLLQKANGVFYLVIWRELRLWQSSKTPKRQTFATQNVTVTLNSGGARQFTRYIPSDSTAQVAAPTTVTALTFALGDKLQIVQIG